MKINEKIRTLRIRSRLTQNQTADFLDVTPSFIAQVENGTAALTADMVNRLTALYCIPLEDLIGDNEECLQNADDLSGYSVDDLKAIADVSRIALNANFMTRRLKQIKRYRTKTASELPMYEKDGATIEIRQTKVRI